LMAFRFIKLKDAAIRTELNLLTEKYALRRAFPGAIKSICRVAQYISSPSTSTRHIVTNDDFQCKMGHDSLLK